MAAGGGGIDSHRFSREELGQGLGKMEEVVGGALCARNRRGRRWGRRTCRRHWDGGSVRGRVSGAAGGWRRGVAALGAAEQAERAPATVAAAAAAVPATRGLGDSPGEERRTMGV
ncbi:hypothetical protein PVAP13_9NG221473 [Panicum virgatum]|uniref:Uncharacterized protein n=1 Tax=Panicum virgatum TaxID=38727 RepID=A0A8T0MH31_PANVG|nr:hypothetical protein PVAP13_9NG221473 [Panicum virgatum]